MPTLIVTLVHAKDLAIRDPIVKSSDPYIKFRIGTKSEWVKSSVVNKNLNPVYNEKLTVTSDVVDSLYVEVWDKDFIGSDDFMGWAEVDIVHLKKKKPTKLDLTLKDTESGQVTVILQAEDFGVDN
ncbi:hypothetical protein AKO1_013676 [Acrasis kona]|uniref:C2 domain-containing protein n=1 Tax=Acrasis kona TaxID=1008807 RepID=A0AAW2YMG2_9EUKA